MFALSSMSCNEKFEEGFSPFIKILGKVYHRIGSLMPEDPKNPKFAEMFFYDTDNEINNRIKFNKLNDKLDENIIK